MVWAAISRNYKSPPMRVDGNTNQEKYCEILELSGVFRDMDERHGHGGWVFQDDGAPSHRAKATRQYLSNHYRVLTKELQWPPRSPDLNVIENAWGIMKSRMEVHPGMSPDELFNAAERAWQTITIEEVNRMVNAFDPRVQVCEKVDGESLNRYRKAVRAIAEGADLQEEFASNEADIQAKVGQLVCGSDIFFEFSATWTAEQRIQRSINLINILPEKTRKKVGMPNGFREAH
jgi:hypothetical protein